MQRSVLGAVRRHPRITVAVSLCLLVFAAAAWSFRRSPLPAPAPWAGPLPTASPPPGMAIYQLPTGTYDTPAALAFQGGSFADSRHLAATAILVRHPQGDLLFDAGFGAAVEEHIRALPFYQRSPHHLEQTVRVQLTAAGYDFSELRGIIITHAHWDHVSGLADLAAPVWMNAGEQRYVSMDRDDTRVFKAMSGLQVQTYAFDGPPYLGFPSSHDVWGDGSIVLVPAPGHTPGSIVAFIALPAGKRYALIGDLTWQLDGIAARAERPLLMRTLADGDPAQVRQDLLRLVALAGLFQIVPAHDVRAYSGIPRVAAGAWAPLRARQGVTTEESR